MSAPTHRRLVRRADAPGLLLLWEAQGWAPVGTPETLPGGDDVLVVVLTPAAGSGQHLLAPSPTSVWAADLPHPPHGASARA